MENNLEFNVVAPAAFYELNGGNHVSEDWTSEFEYKVQQLVGDLGEGVGSEDGIAFLPEVCDDEYDHVESTTPPRLHEMQNVEFTSLGHGCEKLPTQVKPVDIVENENCLQKKPVKSVSENSPQRTMESCDKKASQTTSNKRPKRLALTGGCQTSQPIYICELCGKTYFEKSGLRYHKISIHDGQSFTCDICNIKVTRHASLVRHKRKAHNINP